MPTRTLLALLGVSALLAAPVTAGADTPYEHTTQPTAQGRGGAAATVDSVATSAASDVLRRGGNAVDAAVAAARGARRDRAVLLRHRRRRVHGHPHAQGEDHDDRLAREGARRHAARLVLRERRPAPVQRRALQRALRRRPGHRGGLERRAAPLRHVVARPRAAAGDRRRADGLRDRPHVLRAGAGQRRLLRRHPLVGGALPRRGRHGARRRHGPAQPRPGARLRADRAARGGRLLPRPDRRGADEGRGEAAADGRRQPHVAPGPDDAARPARVHRAGARAHARALPRTRRLRHGAAVVGRLDRRRGAQHPRGGAELAHPVGDAEVPLVPRGLALRVRRPRHVARGSRLLRRAARTAALPALRARARCADRSGEGPARRGPARRPGRRGGRRAAAVDHASHGRRRGRDHRRVHVHDRVDRRQRDRRPGLGLPRQQRADRLRLHVDAPRRTGRTAASGRGRRSRRRSCSATASRSSRPARRAAPRSSRPSCRS